MDKKLFFLNKTKGKQKQASKKFILFINKNYDQPNRGRKAVVGRSTQEDGRTNPIGLRAKSSAPPPPQVHSPYVSLLQGIRLGRLNNSLPDRLCDQSSRHFFSGQSCCLCGRVKKLHCEAARSIVHVDIANKPTDVIDDRVCLITD